METNNNLHVAFVNVVSNVVCQLGILQLTAVSELL